MRGQIEGHRPSKKAFVFLVSKLLLNITFFFVHIAVHRIEASMGDNNPEDTQLFLNLSIAL